MAFNQEFLDQVRSRFPIGRVIERKIKLTRKGKLLLGLCPFHNEKTPSFTVYEHQDNFHCFGCGVHGDVYNFIMAIEGITFIEAVEKLADEAGLELPKLTATDQKKAVYSKGLIDVLDAAAQWFSQQLLSSSGSKARNYVESRQILQNSIAKFRIGYAPGTGDGLKKHLSQKGFSEETMIDAGLLHRRIGESRTFDYFRDRLIFPVFDRKGQVIAFGGRILGEGEPKYLNSPESSVFHKGQTLYGLNLVNRKSLEQDPLVVVEGYMDVIMLQQAGFQAVAPLGTAITEDQIHMLWKHSPQPYVCLDGDKAGQKAALKCAMRALPHLTAGNSLLFVELPEGEDPDTIVRGSGSKQFEKIIQRPISLTDLLWNHEWSKKKYDKPEDKALLEKNLFSYASSIKDQSLKQYCKDDFKRRLFESFKGTFKNKSSFSVAPLTLKVNSSYNSGLLRQKILFAAALNHPQILYDIGELFATLEIQDKNLINLRDDIFFALHEQPGLDGEGLNHHLIKYGYSDTLSMILSEKLYIHAQFARPKTPIKTVLEGWKEIWQNVCTSKVLKEDLKSAQHQLSSSMSLKAWSRLKMLSEQLKASKESINSHHSKS